MHMTNRFRLIAGSVVIALGAVACAPDDQLAVTNLNSADAGRALARPADVETFIAGSFASFWTATMGGGLDNVNSQMMMMSLENGSGLANFAMGPRGSIPRSPVLNSRGNSVAAGNLKEYNGLSRAAAAAAVGVSRIQGTFTLGSTAQDLRARSFANFVMGLSLGFQAMIYDSGSVVTSTLAPVNSYIPPIVGSDSVFRVAMLLLESAITLAQNPAATAAVVGFPLPAAWMPGMSLSAANFVRLIRSYKAKIRSGMARTAAERTSPPSAGCPRCVDWPLVLADAQNGITSDLTMTTNTTTAFRIAWPVQQYLYNTWHQVVPLIAGFADTSGAYAGWLSVPLVQRGGTGAPPFLIATPDNRWPTGVTLNAQIVSSGGGCTVATCTLDNMVPAVVAGVVGGKPYFRARPSGENAWDGTFTNSPYDYYRMRNWYNPSPGLNQNGAFPFFLLAENNANLAEAAIRTGAFALATAAIDVSRTAAGLPSVAGIADLVTPVPGGTACVPRTPTGAGNALQCGNLLEAMKWEKRMETMFATFGGWFFDARGWNDLPQGTSLEWPIPYQELDTRFRVAYNRSEVAPTGTYGF